MKTYNLAVHITRTCHSNSTIFVSVLICIYGDFRGLHNQGLSALQMFTDEYTHFCVEFEEMSYLTRDLGISN